MARCRTSPRYLGSQKMKKYHAASVRNLAVMRPRTWRNVKSLSHGIRREAGLSTALPGAAGFNSLAGAAWLIEAAMNAFSSGVMNRFVAGGRYSLSQIHAQRNPMAPVMKKTQRQPSLSAMNAISGGATTAPRLAPVLKSPNAIARSRAGNHSATVLPE